MNMKKTASLLLAVVLLIALGATAMAEDTTYSITINNSTEGHTYEAYQIFTGDLSESVLSNIVWGSSISEDGKTTMGNAASKAESLKTAADAAAFAKEIAPYLTTAVGSANTVTNDKYVISGLAAGYYLVKDQDGSLTGDPDAYTEYIIKVVKDTEATPKSDVPEVEKSVKDTNDSTGETSDWQESADYDIGDSVPFLLKATLANNVNAYTTYKVVFHDTLSAGLTYNNDAKVYIDGKETAGFTVTSAVNEDDTTSLTISCSDVKALGAGNSSVITVEYTARLNDSAVIGSSGNTNKVKLEYSNNPNKSAEGDNETGNTPEDVTVVFSYKTIINKVDGEGNPLAGAAFKLEKLVKGTNGAEDTWNLVKEFTVDAENPATTFVFSGLDDGTYKLTETVTPAGYNTIDPIVFTITAEHTLNGTNAVLSSLNGQANELTFTSDIPNGSLSADVVNKAGATLPETGGMGTTILYIAGGVLVAAAVILLITRRRMNAQE